jgi:hypothetical protein
VTYQDSTWGYITLKKHFICHLISENKSIIFNSLTGKENEGGNLDSKLQSSLKVISQ